MVWEIANWHQCQLYKCWRFWPPRPPRWAPPWCCCQGCLAHSQIEGWGDHWSLWSTYFMVLEGVKGRKLNFIKSYEVHVTSTKDSGKSITFGDNTWYPILHLNGGWVCSNCSTIIIIIIIRAIKINISILNAIILKTLHISAILCWQHMLLPVRIRGVGLTGQRRQAVEPLSGANLEKVPKTFSRNPSVNG